MARMHYYSHRGRRKHPTTLLHRLVTGIALPLALVLVACFFTTGALFPAYSAALGTLIAALLASLARLATAYVLSLVIGIPLGLLAERSHRLESILLPFYDVMESIPVLAFFPIIILFFVHSGFLEGAAVFMLFFSMIWNIAFNTIGGMKVIPGDVKAAGKVFGLTPFAQLFTITLPALFPPLITGSILALADGWNILIVAEALHAYAPSSTSAHDLFGIGSILVSAATTGNNPLLFSAMAVLVVAIALVNIFVWQPLLARAERYKFE
jgi:NitT/TauT family transport system permease protein